MRETSAGRVLLADDEPVFRESTADLLRASGFECSTVGDATSALGLIAATEFDLLICDLEMPGNADLQLVRDIAATAGGLPIIIITGFPTVRSAIACVELPVAAYLTKPVDVQDLRSRAQIAVRRYRAYLAMRNAEARLDSWRAEMQAVAEDATDGRNRGIDMFLSLTLRNVMGTLTDLSQVGRALVAGALPTPHTCGLINCPRGSQLLTALKEVIDVLEQTKGQFRSKQLGDLRKRLELLVEYV